MSVLEPAESRDRHIIREALEAQSFRLFADKTSADERLEMRARAPHRGEFMNQSAAAGKDAEFLFETQMYSHAHRGVHRLAVLRGSSPRTGCCMTYGARTFRRKLYAVSGSRSAVWRGSNGPACMFSRKQAPWRTKPARHGRCARPD